MEEQKDILAALSHNMRTLLTSIIGFSELLLLKHSKDYPEDVKEYLHYIREAGSKLDRLLEITVERYVRVCFECATKVTVAELVSNCSERVKEKARSMGVELVEEVSPDTESIVVEDMLLGETLTGLLLFAVERTPERGKAGLSCSPLDNGILFTVWHTSFSGWQAHARWYLGSRNNSPQNGRVLLLARELSKICGGRFWVEGTLGEVSSLCLLIPPADYKEGVHARGVV
ncbi:MAG: histidine kinase dimerization/phospho-acceptor domain-containing protein [Bacillota bacterium]